jgi:hypothetical protein
MGLQITWLSLLLLLLGLWPPHCLLVVLVVLV